MTRIPFGCRCGGMTIRSRFGVLTIALILTLPGGVWGGTPDSPGPPDSTFSLSLEDLYLRLTTGATGSPKAFTEPATAPGVGTMYTIDEIVGVAPTADNTTGALPGDVFMGNTYWGLRSDGAWGPQTGTMPDNGAVSIMPDASDQTIAAGYHNGSGTVAGDADLVPNNIRNGVNIFSVAGSYTPSVTVVSRTAELCMFDTADCGGTPSSIPPLTCTSGTPMAHGCSYFAILGMQIGAGWMSVTCDATSTRLDGYYRVRVRDFVVCVTY
jgi:hypothetical protein